MIFIGLLLGSVVDRLPRQRLMVAADLVRLAVFCFLPFTSSATAIVVAAAVAGLANGFFLPAVYAGMPNLVDDDELPFANSLFQTTDNLSYAVGPLLGGVIVAASGPHLAYWVNAATFLLSAALLARIPPRALQAAQAISRGHFSDLADGFRAVLRSRALLAVLVAWTIAMLGVASSLTPASEELLASIARDEAELADYATQIGAQNEGEPYRRKLSFVWWRLGNEGSASPDELAADLDLIDRSLRANRGPRIADGKLAELRRRVEIFRFHLVRLDLRLHAAETRIASLPACVAFECEKSFNVPSADRALKRPEGCLGRGVGQRTEKPGGAPINEKTLISKWTRLVEQRFSDLQRYL